MPEISVAVAYALAQSGKPYSTGPARFGPDYYDCSGLVVGSLRHAGVSVPSDVGNTVGLYNWAKRVGGLVSVAQGVHELGAIMIKGRNYGYGPLGHTSFSLGDGREMAAHGRRRGISVSSLNAGFYHDAFIIPGVNYGPPPPPPPKVIPQMERRLHARLHNEQTHGWWEGYASGEVDYLAPTGDTFHGGMVSPKDKMHFAGRTLARLEPRWYRTAAGERKLGYTIRATSDETYVPEAQH